MDRYLKSTAATLPLTWTVNGVATDPTPNTATVTVTREDGTALTSGTATRTGVGTFTFGLTSVQTASVDVLRVDWTSSLGTLTTYAEIVGGFLFSVAQARADATLSNTTTYPTDTILAARTMAEDALERACDLAFVPRYFRQKVDGSGGEDIYVRPRVLTITSVVIGATSAASGTTLTADELSDLECYDDGRVYRAAGWTRGRRNVELKGSHGYATPPPYVGAAALALAKSILVDSPIDVRAASLTTDDGTTQLLKPDGTFGIPSADRVIDLYGVGVGIG